MGRQFAFDQKERGANESREPKILTATTIDEILEGDTVEMRDFLESGRPKVEVKFKRFTKSCRLYLYKPEYPRSFRFKKLASYRWLTCFKMRFLGRDGVDAKLQKIRIHYLKEKLKYLINQKN